MYEIKHFRKESEIFFNILEWNILAFKKNILSHFYFLAETSQPTWQMVSVNLKCIFGEYTICWK